MDWGFLLLKEDLFDIWTGEVSRPSSKNFKDLPRGDKTRFDGSGKLYRGKEGNETVVVVHPDLNFSALNTPVVKLSILSDIYMKEYLFASAEIYAISFL